MIVHIIVYSGAIMILFLFTIMLMNLNKENEVHKPLHYKIRALVFLFDKCGFDFWFSSILNLSLRIHSTERITNL
jgi:NADH:ubiquinone oxidoreductase subunit 6 (subunit J)